MVLVLKDREVEDVPNMVFVLKDKEVEDVPNMVLVLKDKECRKYLIVLVLKDREVEDVPNMVLVLKTVAPSAGIKHCALRRKRLNLLIKRLLPCISAFRVPKRRSQGCASART